jgi:hypothetical protein
MKSGFLHLSGHRVLPELNALFGGPKLVDFLLGLK